jgi:hypothetical protein
MKINKSLTAAITAAAMVAGAGFAYAQSAVTNNPGEPNAQGQTTQEAQPSMDNGAIQSQPSTSTGTTMDNSASPGGMTTPEPRADRN